MNLMFMKYSLFIPITQGKAFKETLINLITHILRRKSID